MQVNASIMQMVQRISLLIRTFKRLLLHYMYAGCHSPPPGECNMKEQNELLQSICASMGDCSSQVLGKFDVKIIQVVLELLILIQ